MAARGEDCTLVEWAKYGTLRWFSHGEKAVTPTAMGKGYYW